MLLVIFVKKLTTAKGINGFAVHLSAQTTIFSVASLANVFLHKNGIPFLKGKFSLYFYLIKNAKTINYFTFYHTAALTHRNWFVNKTVDRTTSQITIKR